MECVHFLLLILKKSKMRHVAAYALLVLGGNASPSASDVTKLLTESGATADEGQVAKMCAALEGKQFHELVSAGLASLSASGPAAAAGGATGGAAAAKVEEVVEEPEEEVDMGGLFGGGDDDY
jgi:large subunit ribosomal protein LP2